jgi:polyferredoxin
MLLLMFLLLLWSMLPLAVDDVVVVVVGCSIVFVLIVFLFRCVLHCVVCAEELQQQAGVFKRNANELKNKMWWKNMKMRLIIAAIVLVILGIIIAIAVVMSKGGK